MFRIIKSLFERPESRDDALVRRMLAAKTSNEISAVIGLPPVRGRSGPRSFY